MHKMHEEKKITMPRMGVFERLKNRLDSRFIMFMIFSSPVQSGEQKRMHIPILWPSAGCIWPQKDLFFKYLPVHNKGNNDTLKSAQFGQKEHLTYSVDE